MGFLSRIAVAAGFLVSLAPAPVFADFVSGSTGSDGELAPTANTELQIPESGIFNFTTVNIPAGVTLTFRKNTQNTPVTILATGNVTVVGSINVSASSGSDVLPGLGGPGGYDGGLGGGINTAGRKGQGPGGGSPGEPRTCCSDGGGSGGGAGFSNSGAGGGTYDTGTGGVGGLPYGNERILPVIGGSGGGGAGGTNSYIGGAGGGGGGAIVIASSGTIDITGSLLANAGSGAYGTGYWYSYGYCYGDNWSGGGGGGGSGGSIRLLANTIKGNGTVSATGGGGGRGRCGTWGGSGSAGRIRLESLNNLRTAGTSPPLTVGYPYGVTPSTMPTLTISSVAGISVPAVPKGAFSSPDVILPFNTQNPVAVVVTSTNIPPGTEVLVKAIPESGTVSSGTAILAGNDEISTASASVNLTTAYPSVLTATVTFQLTASLGGPIYAGGEKVEKIRVAASMMGGSTVTYITTSGKELPAAM